MDIPTTTKHFIMIFCRQGGNFNFFVGDVNGQTLKSQCVTTTVSEAQITTTDVTWSDYISAIGNGSITFTAKVSADTGGNGSQVFLLCWNS